GEVDREHLVPVLVGHLQDGLVDRDARVVDEHVEPAMLLDHLLDSPPAVLGRADVAAMDAGVSAVLVQLANEVLRVVAAPQVAGGDDGALRGEAARNRRADAARAAGDEYDPAIHPRPMRVGRERLVELARRGRGVWDLR